MKYIIVLFAAVFILAGCSDEPDVVTLDSGLKIADDSLGTGRTAKMGDIVTFHFTAWIIKDSSNLFTDWNKDSTRMTTSLGSSKMYNQPIKIKLGSQQFIKGSEEGIEGMKIGGRRTIIIPSYLAYGKEGMGPVPPNTSLKVVIELIDAKQVAEAKQWDADTSKAKTTASGLKYIILSSGAGVNVDSGDVVAVHYTGYLADGKKFDSSVERDEPFVFTLGRQMVIKGWEEGIRLLKKGGKAKLIVPPSLGYGDSPQGPIPPNSTLIFDVELVEVK